MTARNAVDSPLALLVSLGTLLAPIPVGADATSRAGVSGGSPIAGNSSNEDFDDTAATVQSFAVNIQTSPLEALREKIELGISILKDAHYADAARKSEQRDMLCGVLRDAFDTRLFSKLALGTNWDRFGVDERSDFVDAFASRLCTVHLGKLQEEFHDQTVTFIGQDLRGDSLAHVEVVVSYQESRIPITIRMALREGSWMAFDAVVMGISSLTLYRADLNAALNEGLPENVIRNLLASTGDTD